MLINFSFSRLLRIVRSDNKIYKICSNVQQVSSRTKFISSTQFQTTKTVDEAFNIYNGFSKDDKKDPFLYMLLLKTCKRLGALHRAIPLWNEMIINGTMPNAIILGSYLSVCVDNKDYPSALKAYRSLPQNFVYNQMALYHLALVIRTFKATQLLPEVLNHASRLKIRLDKATFGTLSTFCQENDDIESARTLISYAVKTLNVDMNASICGRLMQTFRSNKLIHEAVGVLEYLPLFNIFPEESTGIFIILLSGCIESGQLSLGLSVYDKLVKSRITICSTTCTLLLNLLAKSGRLEEMTTLWKSILNDPKQRHLLTIEKWNSVINGYGQHGKAREAISTFSQMIAYGIVPSAISFNVVLNSCSHAGLISEARGFLKQMSEFNIEQDVKHRTTFVDALGRAGLLKEALSITQAETPPYIPMWMALLGACRTHQNIEIAEMACRAIKQIDPNNTAAHIIMNQMHNREGNIRGQIILRHPKIPGISKLQINGETVQFVAHDEIIDSNATLKQELLVLQQEILSSGHKPDLSLVTSTRDNISLTDEEKVWSLCTHSERIAIAYGILNLPAGETIYITKNLRVCSDCHEATKLISKIRNREIILGDSNRFHHFKNGICSCNDYW